MGVEIRYRWNAKSASANPIPAPQPTPAPAPAVPPHLSPSARLPQPLSGHVIRRKVAERFGVRPDALSSGDRTFRVVLARRVFYAATREHTRLSLNQIGRIACRDHTTVMHGIRMARPMIAAVSARNPSSIDEWIDEAYAYLYQDRGANDPRYREVV